MDLLLHISLAATTVSSTFGLSAVSSTARAASSSPFSPRMRGMMLARRGSGARTRLSSLLLRIAARTLTRPTTIRVSASTQEGRLPW